MTKNENLPVVSPSRSVVNVDTNVRKTEFSNDKALTTYVSSSSAVRVIKTLAYAALSWINRRQLSVQDSSVRKIENPDDSLSNSGFNSGGGRRIRNRRRRQCSAGIQRPGKRNKNRQGF